MSILTTINVNCRWLLRQGPTVTLLFGQHLKSLTLKGKWFTRDHTKLPTVAAINDGDDDPNEDDNRTWCYCQTAKGGSMIGCENPSYAIKWFHMSYLWMKNIPKNKWFCPSCHPSSKGKRSKPTK